MTDIPHTPKFIMVVQRIVDTRQTFMSTSRTRHQTFVYVAGNTANVNGSVPGRLCVKCHTDRNTVTASACTGMGVRRLRNVPYSTPGAPVMSDDVLCSVIRAEHRATSCRLPHGGQVIVTGICVVCGQYPVNGSTTYLVRVLY